MDDLIWVRIFSLNLCWWNFFSPPYNSIVCQVFPCKIFFPLKSVFFHLKSQMVGPLAHRENGLSVPGL